MPAKYFNVARRADKTLIKLPISIQKRITAAFDAIQENPLKGAKLGGELSDYRKVRIGDYRIVYQFNAKLSTVIVLKIEHRQGVYK